MKNLIILGLDIGGANTKAALVKFKNSEISESFSYIESFPFWEKIIDEIPQMFKKIISILLGKHLNLKVIDYIAVTITAELSDAFQTKREGILTILNALDKVFDKKKMFFINNSGKFIDYACAKSDFSTIAAANWVSTSLYLGQFISQCILIDAGSTTIDIIPILNSIPVAKGNNDISRIVNHELIYTGGLRATIPSITHFVPYKGKLIRISFEKFALVSDVHLILNNISENEYINDTADSRSKSIEDCYARLARIICMDIETISKEELNEIAEYIYKQQLELISSEIQEFMKYLIIKYPEFKENPLFVITGLSADFLVKNVLESFGYNNIKNYEDITKVPDRISSSAFAVAGAFYFQNK
ncbi:MAG: hydantoinase/oxoprolinase family protein [Candidatus Hodarchaeota archaeon]